MSGWGMMEHVEAELGDLLGEVRACCSGERLWKWLAPRSW